MWNFLWNGINLAVHTQNRVHSLLREHAFPLFPQVACAGHRVPLAGSCSSSDPQQVLCSDDVHMRCLVIYSVPCSKSLWSFVRMFGYLIFFKKKNVWLIVWAHVDDLTYLWWRVWLQCIPIHWVRVWDRVSGDGQFRCVHPIGTRAYFLHLFMQPASAHTVNQILFSASLYETKDNLCEQKTRHALAIIILLRWKKEHQ